MAHFYGEVRGKGASASRTGTKASGIVGHIRGWDTGVRVEIDHIDGKDVVKVYATGGSNHPQGVLLRTWSQANIKLV